MPKLKVENQYKTMITSSSGIAASWDVSFTVTTPPINPNGFIVISPDSVTLREIMYYHDVTGNTISVRGENRISPKAHSKSELVQINDIAEIFNTYSDMISTCFYVEKTGWITIKVWGWIVYYNWSPQTVADTSLTLTDNITNYVKYDFATNTISVDGVNSWNVKVIISVVSWVIMSIWYNVSKESLATQWPQGIQWIQGEQGIQGIQWLPWSGWDMYKADNLSWLANNNTARSNLWVPAWSWTSTNTNTGDETLATLWTKQFAAASKATPVDADWFNIFDSAASNVMKLLSFTNLKSFLKTYFDGLYLLKSGGVMTGKVTQKWVDEVGATYAPASGAQTVALNATANNIHIVTGNAAGTAMTFTISWMTNDQVIIVSILQGAVVSTISWWFATVRWAGWTTPALTPTVGKRDTFAFKRTGANTYDGFIVWQNN